MMLKHFQDAGHRPISLIGGATGMIGDPSMKSQERNLLDEDTLRHNQECIKAQLSRFIDFESDAPNAAILVNNYDWMKDWRFLDFTREIGKLITVNYMMAKDSVKKRLSGEGREGMSFTEFTYQLLQGYDFTYLYEHYGCKLQMGGSDQWGNITTGTELIRRKLGGEAYGLTWPLMTKSDGGKFGKTEKGNIWLSPEYTTPYAFYQFWLNVSDEDAARYIKIFTTLGRESRGGACQGPSPAGAPEAARTRDHRHGTRAGGIRQGRGCIPDPLRQVHLRDSPLSRRKDLPLGIRRRAPVQPQQGRTSSTCSL